VRFGRPQETASELAVIDRETKVSRIIEIKPLPEMSRLRLRDADQRKDGTFVVSAAWDEAGAPERGLLFLAEDGRILKKAVSNVSIGRIALLDHGLVAATIQPTRDGEPRFPGGAMLMMLGYYDLETGVEMAQSAIGWPGDFKSFWDQARDLMVRSVSPVPGGSVLSQPASAVAHRIMTGANRSGPLSFLVAGDGGTTWFEKPMEGPFEAMAIVPFVRDGRTRYVVAWARRRPDALSVVLPARIDRVILAAYREGGSQSAIATLEVPSDLHDLASDGVRVFTVAGSPTGWRIDEVGFSE
jgi:hypothetical protein